MHHARSFVADNYPPHRRPTLLGRTMNHDFSVGLAIRSCASRPLDATVQGFHHPRLGMARVHFSAHSTEPAHPSHQRSRLLITILKEGCALLFQDGRECRLLPGDMALIDPSRPFSAQTENVLAHSLYLPRSGVRSLMPTINAMTGRSIPTASGAGALFKTFLEQLIDTAPALDDVAIDLIADAVPPLLSAALKSAPSGEGGEPLAPMNQMAHLHRIWTFVNDHLDDPRLGPNMVARAVNLSPRYVNQLMLTQGDTLMRIILAKRLDRCHAELLEPRLKGRKIGEIAFEWGFQNLSHFCRAFRQKFGYSAAACRSGLFSSSPPGRIEVPRQTPPDDEAFR